MKLRRLVMWLLRCLLGVVAVSHSLSFNVETRRSLLRPWHQNDDGTILGWCEEQKLVEDDILKVSVGLNAPKREKDNNQDILHISLPCSQDGGSLSSSLWPSGIAASILLWSPSFRSIAKNKKVLELGSGLGISGMVAAAESASCILTDNDEEAISRLNTVLERNCNDRLKAKLSTRELDWRDSHTEESPVNIVVGSDIAYYFHLLRPIMDTTKSFLEKKDSLFVAVGQADRESQWNLYHNLRDGCYNQLTDENEPPWAGKTYTLLYKLEMSRWCAAPEDVEKPENCEGVIQIAVLVHQTEGMDIDQFTSQDHVATREDDDSILRSF